MYVNVNNEIFAKEGARVAPCMGISGWQPYWLYIGTEQGWARIVASNKRQGDDWYEEAYSNSNNVGPIGNCYFISQNGYVYGYVMNMYGDLDSFGFTTEGIHKRYLKNKRGC